MDGLHVNVFWGVQSQNQRGSEAGKEEGVYMWCITELATALRQT